MPVAIHEYQHFLPGGESGPAYIAGLAGGGTGFFVDQNSDPRFFLCDAGWSLITNAGRWGGYTWQQDIDFYLQTRADQGFTAVFTCPIATTHIDAVDDSGDTWDGVAPFTSAYTTLNGTFWARVDYLLTQAQALGITIVHNALFTYALSAPANVLYGINTGTNPHDYGLALGNRYKNYPNLIWHFGDDYDGESWPDVFDGVIAGIRDAGDTHPCSIEESAAGSTSRYPVNDSDYSSPYRWAANASYQWCYYYAQAYFDIEFAYGEPSPIPVIQGDGMYWGEVSGGDSANDRAMRQQAWWAVSSGSRGYSTAQVAVHKWGSGSRAAMTAGSWFTAWAGNMRDLVEGLPGWERLIPDTSSQLVTAGRGTRATYNGSAGQGWVDLTDSYVTASRVADGSLAVIYMTHAATITIDESKMAAGYTATWVDPASCATSSATPGTTYNSGAKGNNSAGNPDWVLVLAAP
jgi:Protein of unknown function (DUF4038)